MTACSIGFAAFLLVVVVLAHSTVPALGKKNTHNTRDSTPCNTNNDCATDRVCTDDWCVDPCQDKVCGNNNLCQVTHHIAKCACQRGKAGHPFTGCFPVPTVSEADRKNVFLAKPSGAKKRYYLYSDSMMNWFQSVSHCNSLNMWLATINSPEEQDRLVNIIKQNNLRGNWWLGGSDLAQLGDHEWTSSGTPFTYNNFPRGQPDNYMNPSGEMEHCIELRVGWNFEWNDDFCDEKKYHVCEEH